MGGPVPRERPAGPRAPGSFPRLCSRHVAQLSRASRVWHGRRAAARAQRRAAWLTCVGKERAAGPEGECCWAAAAVLRRVGPGAADGLRGGKRSAPGAAGLLHLSRSRRLLTAPYTPPLPAGRWGGKCGGAAPRRGRGGPGLPSPPGLLRTPSPGLGGLQAGPSPPSPPSAERLSVRTLGAPAARCSAACVWRRGRGKGTVGADCSFCSD